MEKWKNVFRFGVLLAVLFFAFFFMQISVSRSHVHEMFVVDEGAAVSVVARDVARELGVSELFVKVYFRVTVEPKNLRPGSHKLIGEVSVREVAAILQSVPTTQVLARIRDGKTVWEIDKYLAERKIIERGELLACFESFCGVRVRNAKNLEGFLWPDTYFLDSEWSVRKIIEKLVAHGEKKLKSATEKEIIVASLVQKEAGSVDEMPVIAGVIWKRLEKGIPLGIDATARYESKNFSGVLRKSELFSGGDFDTRTKRGLPPWPVSNFNVRALDAAMNPRETEFLFYLHDKSGRVYFAKDYLEHNRNIAKYLR